MITGNRTKRTETGGYPVLIDGEVLDPKPSQRIINHSPNGFNWGYSGSGPGQLALAILLHFSDSMTAIRLYQEFKTAFIQTLDEEFSLKKDLVRAWLLERMTPDEAKSLRKPSTEPFCDLHLCQKRQPDATGNHQCFYCHDGEPEYEELCSKCKIGIPPGKGRYRHQDGAYCESCGELVEKKDFFYL